MRENAQLEQINIVLLGKFNPAIFQPLWLSQVNLIGKDKGNTANIEVLSNSYTKFSIDSQFILETTQERFQITGLSLYPELIKDFVISCFGEVLKETPIHAIGINWSNHFDVGSFETRDKIGNLLAPKTAWGRWGEEMENSSKLLRGGMMTISMKQISQVEPDDEYVVAKVEPSPILPNESGIYVDVNNHYGLSNGRVFHPVTFVLEENWQKSIDRSRAIFKQVKSLTEVI